MSDERLVPSPRLEQRLLADAKNRPDNPVLATREDFRTRYKLKRGSAGKQP